VATLSGLGPKDSGPVFLFRGKPMKSVKTAFDKARLKAGLPDVRFHDLRHTFASRLVQGGVPLYDVMHLTGHKSLQMVQRYAHLAPDYQERAIQALDGLGHNLGTVEGQRAA
jgi:integrase